MRLDVLPPHRLWHQTPPRNLDVDPRQKTTHQDAPGSTPTTLDDSEVVPDSSTYDGQPASAAFGNGAMLPDPWPAQTDAVPRAPRTSTPLATIWGACGSCRSCGRANRRAPTSSLDVGKRTPPPTATTRPSLRCIHTENGRRTQASLSPPPTPFGLNLWTALRSPPVGAAHRFPSTERPSDPLSIRT